MDNQKFCPYIYNCRKLDKLYTPICLGNYENCDEWKERDLEERSLGVGAVMYVENIFKKKKTEQ